MIRVKATIKALLLTFAVMLFSACGSKPLIKDSVIEVKAKESVVIEANKGYDSYSWRQVSGIPVEIKDANSATLKFIAPDVSKKEKLVFELRAAVGDIPYSATVTVIISPKDTDSKADDNAAQGNNGNDNNATGGGSDDNSSNGNGGGSGGGGNNSSSGNSDQNSTNPITTLTLTIDKTTLNRETNTTLKVEATYKDKTTKDITNQAQWLITPKDAIKIEDHTLTALKDTNVTIQAKAGNTLSNQVKLNIYWEVDGHRLPPEPDPKINNSTLLGVDVNNNGVRDDVERWIYNRYKDMHPIHIDIAMQEARADKLILEKQPKTKAEAMKIKDEVDKPVYCQGYYKYEAKYFNEPILIKENVADEYFRSKIYFNTKERMEVYGQYDTLLSGDSYALLDGKDMQKACDFNTSKYDKE
ncbi:MAG: hypothetical protein L3J42_03020 [Hydrogenimonas sp.]|nr:hypothetical protein [Hydrogenimonas sp.]